MAKHDSPQGDERLPGRVGRGATRERADSAFHLAHDSGGSQHPAIAGSFRPRITAQPPLIDPTSTVLTSL